MHGVVHDLEYDGGEPVTDDKLVVTSVTDGEGGVVDGEGDVGEDAGKAVDAQLRTKCLKKQTFSCGEQLKKWLFQSCLSVSLALTPT